MQWNRMTSNQRAAAHEMTGKLWSAGVSAATVSQVAKHYDQVTGWSEGTIPLAALCKITGWAVPAPEASTAAEPQASTVPDLAAAAAGFRRMAENLTEMLAEAKKAGVSANKIAEAVKGLPGYSRMNVLEILGSADLRDEAIAALEAGGWKVGVGGDILVYIDRRRVMIELLDDLDQPANEVTRLNWASGVATSLAKRELSLWSDDRPIDSWEQLAESPVEIVRKAS